MIVDTCFSFPSPLFFCFISFLFRPNPSILLSSSDDHDYEKIQAAQFLFSLIYERIYLSSRFMKNMKIYLK